MSLSTTPNRIGYTGDAVSTAFAFPYKFLDDSLVVLSVDPTTEVETTLVEDTDYTVSGAGDDAGGTVTMIAAPDTGIKIVIYRNTEETQTYDPQFNGPLPVPTLGASLDKLAMMVQRVMDLASRAVRLPDGRTAAFDPTLPKLLSANAGATLMINASGDGLAIGPNADQILQAEEYAALAAAAAASALAAGSGFLTTNFAITAGQAATNLALEAFDGTVFSSVEYFFEISRGTTIFANGRMTLQFINSVWRVILGEYLGDVHGLTFSIVQVGNSGQLKVAADAGSNGTLKLKKFIYEA